MHMNTFQSTCQTNPAQLYTIACHELVGRDPPGRRALCSFLAACDAPVSLLQHRFLCVSQRVCQVRRPADGRAPVV
jgi:hypothetical protein